MSFLDPERDPDQERQRLTAVYSDSTDEELLRIAAGRDELTEIARIVLNDELSRRHINLPPRAATGTDEIELQKVVTIRRFRDLPEALLAKGSLNSSGIECWLVDDNLVRMDWFVSNSIGGIKLQVAAEDVAVATEFLNQPIPENFDYEGPEKYQQPHCPKCQSLDITFQELYAKIAYPSAWVGLPIPMQRSAWKCRACGGEWQANNKDEPEGSRDFSNG